MFLLHFIRKGGNNLDGEYVVFTRYPRRWRRHCKQGFALHASFNITFSDTLKGGSIYGLPEGEALVKE